MFKKKTLNWRTFCLLLLASTTSVYAVFPYALTLNPDLLSKAPFSLEVILLLQGVQSLILFAPLILIGLYLGKKVGLGAPMLERITKGKKVSKMMTKILGPSLLWGAGVALAIFILDFFFSYSVDLRSFSAEVPPAWQGFLASFYGGIGEEVMMRLFLMTVLVWIAFKIKSKKKKPTDVGVWIAIVLAALLFGVGHLPILAQLAPLTPILVVRTILLNGIGGVVFGWLYWKNGLESAMVAHFAADIVLHVIPPLLF